MRFLPINLGLTALLATPIISIAVPSTDTTTSVGGLKFTGTIGGIQHSGIGTAKEIFDAFAAQHPQVAAAALANASVAIEAHELAKGKRGVDNKRDTHCCGQTGGPPEDWGVASQDQVLNNIRYFRIACSGYAGIFLCNDNNYPIEPNCGYLASYAQDILNTCDQWRFVPHWGTVISACGQEFDTDNYNVIVRYQEC
ncbi:hypothetical protein B0J14DRAFT_705306 [Halenospora varia]|nr:hypothetical protein B0J14DRAFT_705306 [Halenospora varia]